MTVTAMPKADAEGTEKAAPQRSVKKLVIILVAVLAIAGYGAWTFVLAPDPGPEEPAAGEVVPLEAIQINLTAGHYLRLGIALQLVEDTHAIDGSKALDRAIEIFSGQDVADLADPEHRGKLKDRLSRDLHEIYHGEVLEVYFTDFVTQ